MTRSPGTQLTLLLTVSLMTGFPRTAGAPHEFVADGADK